MDIIMCIYCAFYIVPLTLYLIKVELEVMKIHFVQLIVPIKEYLNRLLKNVLPS